MLIFAIWNCSKIAGKIHRAFSYNRKKNIDSQAEKF